MAISRRTTATATNGTSSSAIIPAWAGGILPTNGDLLVFIGAAILQTTLTPPDLTWTLLGQQDSGSSLRQWAYYKFASGVVAGETWSLGSATKCTGEILAYTGHDPTAAPTWLGTTGSACPSIAVAANGWLINAGAGRHTNTGAATSWTINDGSAAELLDFGSNVAASNDIASCVYDSNRALTAGSYARTLTPTQTEALSTCMSIAFGPDTGGGGGGGGITSTPGARWGIHV